MAFTITLQTMTSEKNKVDKTITDIATVTGVLKDESTIVDPVVLIEANLSNLILANYMTIPAFGRSYFLHPPKSVNSNLVEISGHCDVLSSFKAQIRTNRAIINRSERNWNLYLNDGSLKTYQYPEVTTQKFQTGFNTGYSYILILA